MKRNRLGKSGVVVSEICMGTMTFGERCDEKLSFEILDKAYEAGIDFFDAAEMYPVPPTEEKYGITEVILGKWMKTKPRDSLIIASKVTGPGHGWFVPPVRHGKTTLDRHQIVRAVEASLQRLQTDYLDLYQTHWPDHDMRPEDTMGALDELVQSGKVRVIGCSNETSYGLMKNLWTSDMHGFARYDTIQNNFSLNSRRFEDELAQVCLHEKVSLLPYSPLAGGVLSGKYNQGNRPAGARFSHYLTAGNERQVKMAQRFVNDAAIASTERFQAIADEAGMHVITLATAWSKQHDYVASTIVGATTVEQLDPIFKAADLNLDGTVLAKIDAVSQELKYPMG
jgi:aryl-alcohol dehydrogenase-like predicted oxidoreductase